MKFRLPPNAFPPLKLTREETRWLRDEMTAVVAETARVERQFVDPLEGRAVFPKKDWKLVRSRDDFSVYKERRSKRAAPTKLMTSRDESPAVASVEGFAPEHPFSVDSLASEEPMTENVSTRSMSTVSGANTLSSNEDHDSIVGSMKEPHVPMLVAAGTLDCSLDDTVFGAQSGDEVAWRMRTAYVKDKFADARILAKIDGPTVEDPFRSLCVKWFTKEVPALVNSFIQRRDFLILEATGCGEDTDGTRYGYYLIHSVKIPGAPELAELNVIRCKVSLCFICRELPNGQSSLFARGFSDARGEMIEKVGIALTSESIIAATMISDCSYAKKLTWLMQKKQRARQLRMQRAGSVVAPHECESCQRGVKKLSIKSQLHPCQACGNMICQKCTVQKRMIVDVSGDGAVDRTLTFCFGCVMEAKRQSAWQVASDALSPEDLQEHRYKQQQLARSMAGPPSLARAQSLDFDASRSSSSVFTRSAPPSANRAPTVRPHSSKSVAGVVLY